MPIYEFLCERCGSRFEELVAAGAESAACGRCGDRSTQRVYSAQGAPFKLVKTRGETRRQERRNAKLRERTKRRFKEGRRSSSKPRAGSR